MKTFFKVITALLAAVGAVLITMKLLDAVSRGNKDKKHISAFKGNAGLAEPGRRSRLGAAARAVSDEIGDYRFDDDDLFADAVEAIADELTDKAEDIFDEIADAAEDVIDEFGELAEETADKAEDFIEDISEDDLDRLLGGDD